MCMCVCVCVCVCLCLCVSVCVCARCPTDWLHFDETEEKRSFRGRSAEEWTRVQGLCQVASISLCQEMTLDAEDLQDSEDMFGLDLTKMIPCIYNSIVLNSCFFFFGSSCDFAQSASTPRCF